MPGTEVHTAYLRLPVLFLFNNGIGMCVTPLLPADEPTYVAEQLVGA